MLHEPTGGCASRQERSQAEKARGPHRDIAASGGIASGRFCAHRAVCRGHDRAFKRRGLRRAGSGERGCRSVQRRSERLAEARAPFGARGGVLFGRRLRLSCLPRMVAAGRQAAAYALDPVSVRCRLPVRPDAQAVRCWPGIRSAGSAVRRRWLWHGDAGGGGNLVAALPVEGVAAKHALSSPSLKRRASLSRVQANAARRFCRCGEFPASVVMDRCENHRLPADQLPVVRC